MGTENVHVETIQKFLRRNHGNRFPYVQYFPVDLMDLLLNPEKKFYNCTLTDLEISYHL